MYSIMGVTRRNRTQDTVQRCLDRAQFRGPIWLESLSLRGVARFPPPVHHGAGRERHAALYPGAGYGGVQRSVDSWRKQRQALRGIRTSPPSTQGLL